jgi:menaquinol-cytochrome c reductase iron-sulfur subunit
MNELLHRRKFLNQVSIAGSALMGIVVSVPIIAYLLSPFLDKPKRDWQDLGPLTNYKIGETVAVELDDPSPLPWAGQTARTSAWLRRAPEGLIAFSVHCTHLGCPVNWINGGQIFLCPCHGGVFDAQGDPVGGPPGYPLQRHDVRVTDGRVEIRPVPLKFG